ncbi:hypothetical protein DYBT9275_03935 [Dyadobacter sp. CECT 9275]|uniref:Type 1 periplasmic binding fold superfamily protein n=1 Tax=Dyadobacter helix TaxID=2822344 RepID=A0A916JED1_9BACT|nr:hypothetical protein [Dyadobacter sp. CECT 9275]CAG5006963.1 hypothetical protein DYBT9275_03935 [Dyadobacter sp. CECT 9275]
MKRNKTLVWIFLIGIVTLFAQCKDSGEELKPDDENELITTVKLTFTESGTSNALTFQFKDLDGDGGNPASRFDTIALKADVSYKLDVEFLDESKTPAENTTEEIKKESDEHLIVFTSNPAALLTYTYGDKDVNNFPIGLTGTAKTGTPGEGKLTVQLRHQPGVKNGTPSPGSDDARLDFILKVK